MDVAAVRRLGTDLERAADDLESARDQVGVRMAMSFGFGPDMDEFRGRWSSELAPSLSRVCATLREAAQSVRLDADQQDTASNDGGGSGGGHGSDGGARGPDGGGRGDGDDGGGGPLDWLRDRGEDLWDAGGDALDWLGDRGEDLADGASTWWDATSDDWLNVGDSFGQLWDATGGSILDGRWPRTTEVAASMIMGAGALGGALYTTATGDEANLFDDGDPYAGDPRRVPTGANPDGVEPLRIPDSLDDLTASVTDAYLSGDGSVRVTTIETADGPRVIVSVPGTESWSPGASSNPMDLTGNLVTAGGGSSTMSEAVELAMRNANIPEGAEVMLVGHSQGGMTVADLTSDPDFVSRYNVTNAMTFGSPIDSQQIDPRVSVLELQHQTDVVPRLDMEDSLYVPNLMPPGPLNPLGPAFPSLPGLPSFSDQTGANHATVTLPNPGPWYDAAGNHSHQAYSSSILQSTDPGLSAYEQQLRQSGFLSGSPGTTSAVDVTVGRRD
ncbi:hypothetical protein V5D56_16090 [Cellulosimicrobium sp. PMB13]|uniref:hypothetical protein n=1 Tax=Cellulosimicrobium sp. PMB13 TaxID=3120158 RepID=UPI003F4AF958